MKCPTKGCSGTLRLISKTETTCHDVETIGCPLCGLTETKTTPHAGFELQRTDSTEFAASGGGSGAPKRRKKAAKKKATK